jgi:hypothetical protein
VPRPEIVRTIFPGCLKLSESNESVLKHCKREVNEEALTKYSNSALDMVTLLDKLGPKSISWPEVC